MKVVALDIKGGHLGVTDLDALRIGPRIEFTTHRQTGLCGRGGDQFDDRQPAGQRLATPVLADMAEQAVLNLVPL